MPRIQMTFKVRLILTALLVYVAAMLVLIVVKFATSSPEKTAGTRPAPDSRGAATTTSQAGK